MKEVASEMNLFEELRSNLGNEYQVMLEKEFRQNGQKFYIDCII